MAKTGRKPEPGPGIARTAELYNQRTADTLGHAAKVMRDCFVREYIKDFNGKKAMYRIGYTGKSAAVRANQLMREPYVAQRLDELVRQLRPEDVVTRGQVMAKLWEEANNPLNLCSTRVNAAAHCGKMLGMGVQQKDETLTPVGVMMIPVSSPEEWAAAAPIAQAMLKAAAAKHG